jgi:hypothetical protein
VVAIEIEGIGVLENPVGRRSRRTPPSHEGASAEMKIQVAQRIK